VLELTEWAASARLPDKPWLILGKGPTFSRRGEYDLTRFNLLSLNHAVVEQAVDVAHVVDIDVVEDCGDALLRHCRWLLMPRHPHVAWRPTVAKLEEFVPHVPVLQALEEQGRLVWYNAATGPAERGSPVVDLRFFSSEAALSITGLLGATTVRSLGVDGGRSYSVSFSALAKRTLLQNGQPSFDRQFSELDRIAAERGIDFRPLIAPMRVFIGADPTQYVAARVLEHSLHGHASGPVRVALLDQPLSSLPRDPRNHPRTPFSFNRFRIPALAGYEGAALYVDSDMLVFGDVSEVFSLPFGSHVVLCARQDEPPKAWKDHEGFHPGRQFSVMLVDCERARWDLDEIVESLDAGRLTYEQLMFDLAVVPSDGIGETIPPEWNHLEQFEPGVTKLLHYSVVPTQPWRNDENDLVDIWMAAYAEAVKAGAVDRDEVSHAVAKGWVKPALADPAFFETPAPTGSGTSQRPVDIELAALRQRVAYLEHQLEASPAETPAEVGTFRRLARGARLIRTPRRLASILRSRLRRPGAGGLP